MTAPTALHSVAWFPTVDGGWQTWANYDGPRHSEGMGAARRLGFNCIRTFLAARTGAFSVPEPMAFELARLTDFCQRGQAAGLQLHLSLFDMQPNIGCLAASKKWAEAVISAIPDTSVLAVIEIKNELPYALTVPYSGGFDAGWPVGAPRAEAGRVARAWAVQMIPFIRMLAPGVPVTASATGKPSGHLTALVAATKGTEAEPDWYEWHCYDPPGWVNAELQEAIAVAGGPSMLRLGETGYEVTAAGTQGPAQIQQAQADYLQANRWYCCQLGLGEPSPWMLADLEPCDQFPSGSAYGLLDGPGNPRLAAKMYERYPPGTQVPPVALNGNMRGTPHADADGNLLPPRWCLYRGQTGAQPISATVDTSTLCGGHPSILLTGSAATRTSDNQPALEADPLSPVICAGRQYAFSCSLKGSGSCGTPSFAVAWYGQRGRWISSANGPPLTIAGSFVRYSLTAAAPRGALYARLFVRTGGNAGSIWAAGASWEPAP